MLNPGKHFMKHKLMVIELVIANFTAGILYRFTLRKKVCGSAFATRVLSVTEQPFIYRTDKYTLSGKNMKLAQSALKLVG
jgi:hypothetical protein